MFVWHSALFSPPFPFSFIYLCYLSLPMFSLFVFFIFLSFIFSLLLFSLQISFSSHLPFFTVFFSSLYTCLVKESLSPFFPFPFLPFCPLLFFPLQYFLLFFFPIYLCSLYLIFIKCSYVYLFVYVYGNVKFFSPFPTVPIHLSFYLFLPCF